MFLTPWAVNRLAFPVGLRQVQLKNLVSRNWDPLATGDKDFLQTSTEAL